MDPRTQLFYDRASQDLVTAYEQADMSQMRGFLSQLSGQGSLLDIGCGTGRDAAYYLGLGYDVTAIDASLSMVETARRLHPELATRCFQEGLPLDLDVFGDQRFDNICCAAVLMHIPDQDLSKSLQQMTHLLKPGGRLMISVSRYRPGLNEDERDADGRLFRERDPGEYASLLAQQGCALVMSASQDDALGRDTIAWVTMVFAQQLQP